MLMKLEKQEDLPENIRKYFLKKTATHKAYEVYVYEELADVKWDVIAQTYSIIVRHYVPSISTRKHSALEDTPVRYVKFETNISVNSNLPCIVKKRNEGATDDELEVFIKDLLSKEALRVALQDFPLYLDYMQANTYFVSYLEEDQATFCKRFGIKQVTLLEHHNPQGLLPSWKFLSTRGVNTTEVLQTQYNNALSHFKVQECGDNVPNILGFDLADAIKALLDKPIAKVI